MSICDAVNTTSILAKDALRLLVGDQIGRGCSRQVYALQDDDTKVLKIESGSYDFQNVLEHDVWCRTCWTDHHVWLAPVVRISPCGTCLLMERTCPVGVQDLPKFIPEWLTDTKPENWGWWRGRVVCHDYGFNRLLDVGLTKKVRRADWSR